ncbi:sushi, von Willebrand factor type A, EGF and pentraxin domain-containing protein 1 isoform X3 [Scyliorhinus canicula]|uniref:sushi, von Willebrand factor type A, EGF and pentraxin domain-containing protein 1 isoform X3 n=1 Tax=Scyliorhinus canicula TaxID=7830 RepID=UPI0018F31C33|nr:sushi, von Willebrand factor type A, EGF and pentraxin domain-containing protein 1 isoform X3 [Scyliorhinus canicula]XP_038660095.1 sushi, von Willebrand factor type A, EGF and pentraxin domain-containing protein 1 isoform X3 [Scyliorhinus canicula]
MRTKLPSAWSFTALVLSLYLGVFNTDFLYLHAAADPTANLDVCSTCHVNASCTITSGNKACTCNYGFYGNGITFCADKDECNMGAKRICGDFTTCYNTFGGYYCTCNEGYRPSNNKEYMESFTPNDGTQCAIVDCGSPPALLNMASHPPVNTTYGRAVVYHCQVGYVRVRGNGTSICSAQGQWEGANLECEAVDCKSPPVLLNTVSYRAVNTTYGSTVVYYCQVGYVRVRGNNTSICSALGQWEGANLECDVVDCRSPPALLDTVPYPPVNRTYGSAVVYHCQVGYVRVRGNDTSICSAQGQWEGANLECTAIDCGSPPALLNTVSHPPVNTTYGSAVVYHCQVGYEGVRGNDTSICSAQGQWEGANLECEAVECGSPPALQDTVQYPPRSTTYGGTAAYQCQVGYFHPRGNATLTCSAQGRWEGANLECKVVDCKSPPALLNTLSYPLVTTIYGSAVVYHCQVGYVRVRGNDTSICSAQGQWEGANLECEAIACLSPPALPNTVSQPPVNTTYGSAVVYHCQVGYVIVRGNYTSICSAQGQWEGANLECEAVDCGSPPALLNTVLHSPVNTTYGRAVVYHCQVGYEGVRGNDTSICSAQGQWEGANLECEAVDCGSPPALLNTVLHSPVNTTYGRAVVYHCQVGYEGVRGNDTSICSAQGQWEGANLECEAVDCGSPPALLNTVLHSPVNTTYGRAVVYHCQVGYEGVRGNDTSICSAQGQWEGANLECEAVDCGSPPALLNTVLHSPVNTTYGSAVVYHCQVGYEGVRGNDTSICSAQGQWEGANLECEAVDCGSPPALLNTASQPPVNTTYGSAVMYHCQVGYMRVRGNGTSICSAQGQWEGANLECEAVDCESPPALLNTVSYHSVNTTYGSVVVYHCQVGYVLVRGNNTSICSAQGQWEGANLECEEIDCGIPPAIPRTELLQYNCTRRESVVHYRCRDGFYTVSGRSMSVCTEAGRWEEVTLLCKVNDFILFNESCLKWRRDRFGSRSEDTYSFQIQGQRSYQSEFIFETSFNYSTADDAPVVCLNLQPGTNYTVNITALTLQHSAHLQLSTAVTDPPVPAVQVMVVEQTLPPLILRRVENKNGPISFYQVVVLPLPLQHSFDCSSQTMRSYFGHRRGSEAYITAEFLALDVEDGMRFSVGDRLYYREYYNAALESGKNYSFLLKTISEWNSVKKQSCVTLAQLKGVAR